MSKELKNKYLSNLFDQLYLEVQNRQIVQKKDKTVFRSLLRDFANTIVSVQ